MSRVDQHIATVAGCNLPCCLGDTDRQRHKPPEKLTDRKRRNVTATLWRSDKDDAVHLRYCFREQGLTDQVARGVAQVAAYLADDG